MNDLQIKLNFSRFTLTFSYDDCELSSSHVSLKIPQHMEHLPDETKEYVRVFVALDRLLHHKLRSLHPFVPLL